MNLRQMKDNLFDLFREYGIHLEGDHMGVVEEREVKTLILDLVKG